MDGNCLGTPLFEGSDIPEDMRAVFDTGDTKGFDKADYGLLPVRVEGWGIWSSSTSTRTPRPSRSTWAT